MAASHPIIPGASIQLQPGFMFRPTDEDIVVHYLRRRAVNEPLPSAVIVDINLLSHNPWDLLPEGSMEKYYFSQRVPRSTQGTRFKRATGDGYWKASGNDVPIFSSWVNGRDPVVIGLKKTLVFYRGKAPAGERTEWVMQEYCRVGAGLMPYRVMRPRGSINISKCGCASAVIAKKNDELSEALRNAATASLNMEPVMLNPDGSWVVCRIYKKKKSAQRVVAQRYNTAGGGQVPFVDFIGQGRNLEGTASSSRLTGPRLEKENDDTDDKSGIKEKACSGEGK